MHYLTLPTTKFQLAQSLFVELVHAILKSNYKSNYVLPIFFQRDHDIYLNNEMLTLDIISWREVCNSICRF